MSEAFWQNLPAIIAAVSAGLPAVLAALVSLGNRKRQRKMHAENSEKIARIAASVETHVKECTEARKGNGA